MVITQMLVHHIVRYALLVSHVSTVQTIQIQRIVMLETTVDQET